MDDEPRGERDSGMSIDLTISVGYKRRRPNTSGDRVEARLDSIGLMLAGAAVVIILLVFLVPKILAALP